MPEEIKVPNEAYALCKKHPWPLFKVQGRHYAHRKEVRRIGKDGNETVREAVTVPFTADNQDMPPAARLLFQETINEMERGLT